MLKVDILEKNRKLCLKKDLDEINLWMYTLEMFNEELDAFKTIEKQLLKSCIISHKILSIRRKNTLNMATLCKYENALKIEYSYGKIEYDDAKAKQHEKSRRQFTQLLKDHNSFKKEFYNHLKKFKRD